MKKVLRIGTRDSQLAIWQANFVREQLAAIDITAELVFIKSDGDLDLVTPLYALGVQGVFTKTLDAALLSNRIDIAVHSMKDVPTQLARGLQQAAVLPRASFHDILVYRGNDDSLLPDLGYRQAAWQEPATNGIPRVIASSSVRRRAQWLHRYPAHRFENLRGNVNTRLHKLSESNWDGAIFAAAGLERIDLRPETSVTLNWMLPAPAQGAIMIAAREGDKAILETLSALNDPDTALCTKLEKDFLKALMGGCATPISALAQLQGDLVQFEGNLLNLSGTRCLEIRLSAHRSVADNLGQQAAEQLLSQGAHEILATVRDV
ncbi:MAG TPA: hydroxymethylbilane synthase [Sediminibacterium sp.]|nr:hydroxymethylbilane synthase [Sediminibacterium sp.]